jgi:hypothetical protein
MRADRSAHLAAAISVQGLRIVNMFFGSLAQEMIVLQNSMAAILGSLRFPASRQSL